jgi:glucosylceramidase
LLCVVVVLLSLSGSVCANQALPPDFSLVLAEPGIELYKKDYAQGNPDFVQIVKLNQGARVELLHGGVVDPGYGQGVYGGASPSFVRQALPKVWNDFSSDEPDVFCLTNGQFFVTNSDPTELAFPLKKDGIVVSDGYGIDEYPNQKLMLEIWSDRADIVSLSREALYASSAPNIIAGLSENADKGPNNLTGRTFFGVSDGDKDGQYETILVFNSKTARQKDAAAILRSFGAEKVIMLDGGGSTQLICNDELYVSSNRAIPQTLATVGNDKNKYVEVWLTTGDKSSLLQQQPNLNFQEGVGHNELTITVDETIGYQQMEGFGAALTDSSAWLIANELDVFKRGELMRELFSDQGIGISHVRISMGASDFSVEPYMYQDFGGVFSIAHDLEYIVPLLQDAKHLNPQLQVLATPWSAPTWMKSNQEFRGGSLKGESYDDYATYFVNFIQQYQQAGISIDAVTIQNEPENGHNYPSMFMSSQEQADFVKVLGPAFAEVDIDSKIFIWDHNWNTKDYALAVLADEDANQYIGGSAWHCYESNEEKDVKNQGKVHLEYPDKDVYFTECSGGSWKEIFSTNLSWNVKYLFVGAVRNCAKTVLLWNLALRPDGTPHLEGACGANKGKTCRGVVTISDGGYVKNEEYYAIGHFSKFVFPEAHRIESDTHKGLENIAFKNTDHSIVLVVHNSTDMEQLFDVKMNNTYISYTLPQKSLVTFRWMGNIQVPSTVSCETDLTFWDAPFRLIRLRLEKWWKKQKAKFDTWWKGKREEIKREIERTIEEEIERRLQELCGTAVLPFVIMGVIIWLTDRKG